MCRRCDITKLVWFYNMEKSNMKKQILLRCAAAMIFSLLLCGCSETMQVPYKYEPVSTSEEKAGILTEQESKDESMYVRALEEENAMHYTYAKELFLQIMDYKDSKAHYDNLLKILTPYNGSYIMEAENGGSYTITIRDGIGTMSWDNLSDSIHTMNLYGMYFRDVSDEVCMVFDVNLGKEDWNYGGTQDKYVFEVDETGAVKVHGLDGNKEHVWDGSGAREE